MHWCAVMYNTPSDNPAERGALMAETRRCLREPWERVASGGGGGGRGQWERVEACGLAWSKRNRVLRSVWFHALRKNPGLFWEDCKNTDKEAQAVRAAVQSVAAGYAAALLPPLGRRAHLNIEDITTPPATRPQRVFYRNIPAAAWSVVADFFVARPQDAMTWRRVAGGEWSLGLWHMGRARWSAPGGLGLQLPSVGAVAHAVEPWRAAMPALLANFEVSLTMTEAAARWYRPTHRHRKALRCTPLRSALWGEEHPDGRNPQPRPGAPALRLTHRCPRGGARGAAHARTLESYELFLSLEDVGLPFFIRACTLDIVDVATKKE